MRVIVLAGFISGLAVGQSQQQPAANNSNADKQTIRVEGTVFSMTGEAVRKATVRLQGSTPQQDGRPTTYSESTGNDGKFVFEDVAPGRYTLSSEKAGFVSQRYGARSSTTPGTTLDIRDSQKDLNIKMTPQGVITGRVTDRDGDIVVSAQIQVLRFTYVRGRKQLNTTATGTSNDQGEYRISGIAPGRYYLRATDRNTLQVIINASANTSTGRAAQEGNVQTYYPNGTDAASAVALDVAAGAELRGIDIRLQKSRVYSIRGHTEPPTQVVVSFIPKQDGLTLGNNLTQTRPDGNFEYRGQVPGTYVLQTMPVTTNGNGPNPLIGRIEITLADANLDNVVLPLGPGMEILGSVKLEDGDIAALLKPPPAAAAPTPNAPINALVSMPRVALTDLESAPISTPNAILKEDGTFMISSLSPGKYSWVLNNPPKGTYVKSVKLSGQDVTHTAIDLTSGGGGKLEMILSNKAADVSGTIHDDKGEAMAGMPVTLWPKIPEPGNQSQGVKFSFTDQKGGFRFDGLAAGEFYVAVWDDIETSLAQTPDFLAHFNNDAAAVKLNEGGHESVEAKLISHEKIVVEMAKLP